MRKKAQNCIYLVRIELNSSRIPIDLRRMQIKYSFAWGKRPDTLQSDVEFLARPKLSFKHV